MGDPRDAAVRTETFKSATLYLGDALEVLPLIQSVSVTMTDPPYEQGMHDAKSTKARNVRKDGGPKLQALGFEAIDPIRSVVTREIARVTQGWSLIFCTPEGVAAWRDEIEAAGAKYKRACVWTKPDSAPQFNGQGPAMGAEMIVTAWCGPGYSKWNGGGSRGVWTFPCNPPDRTGLHPTEKPIALMSHLVALFSQRDDVILDPFMGIGSTGVAAIRYARRFVGIERDEKYFDAACRRIEAAESQGDLLIDIARDEPVQIDAFSST